MDEGEYIRQAEQTLQEIARRVEASGIDADCELFAALSDCARQQQGEAVDPGTGGA